MKIRGLGVFIVAMALILVFTSCALIKPIPVGKIWKGTAIMDIAAGSISAGSYGADITLKFEWLFGNKKITGGTIKLTPLLTTADRVVIEPFQFTITGGEYTEVDETITFTGKEIDLATVLIFTGTIVSKEITNGIITHSGTPKGDFVISEQ